MTVSGEKKTAVIIGAGPAGLTAAYELLTRTSIHPIVFESDPTYVGGISKTVAYKGNRIDIGGHRFFSKSDRIMAWWLSMLPLEVHEAESLSYQGKTIPFSQKGHAQSSTSDDVMLVRSRETHIYYNHAFFSYPVTLSFDTVRKLGIIKMCKIAATYGYRSLFPRYPEKTLEDFFINRFGDELYVTFFKSYTEKVWGAPCDQISPEWGAQRVKGLSVSKVIANALAKPFRKRSLAQTKVETSLIERFLYPKYGPGHLWEYVARRITELGGAIRMGSRVVSLAQEGDKIRSVTVEDTKGRRETYTADYVFSTMPIRELGSALAVDGPVRTVMDGLEYRDFITVGLLIRKGESLASTLSDTWIYIHDPSVQVGRIQFFNNWSPALVQDPEHTAWIGLEYFCNEGDALWSTPDAGLVAQATAELERIGLAHAADVLDGTVLRQPKAYTSYTGSYHQFSEVRNYLDGITNLFPIGRNGMHRYNNQDHSMLVAMTAVDNICAQREDKSNLWDINTDQEYHEEK